MCVILHGDVSVTNKLKKHKHLGVSSPGFEPIQSLTYSIAAVRYNYHQVCSPRVMFHKLLSPTYDREVTVQYKMRQHREFVMKKMTRFVKLLIQHIFIHFDHTDNKSYLTIAPRLACKKFISVLVCITSVNLQNNIFILAWNKARLCNIMYKMQCYDNKFSYS